MSKELSMEKLQKITWVFNAINVLTTSLIVDPRRVYMEILIGWLSGVLMKIRMTELKFCQILSIDL